MEPREGKRSKVEGRADKRSGNKMRLGQEVRIGDKWRGDKQ